MHRELQAQGLPASPKRVARLMREDGLVARPRKRPRVSTTDSNHTNPIAPNLLARQFDVNGVGINWTWVADLTYIPTREGMLYLATVLDLGRAGVSDGRCATRSKSNWRSAPCGWPAKRDDPARG